MHPRSGFSLVELLVVLAIIVVLSAMTLSMISLVKSQVRRTVCASNLRQIGMGFEAYANDWSGILPRMNAWDTINGGVLDYLSAPARDTGVIKGCPERNMSNFGGDQFSYTGYTYNCYLDCENDNTRHNRFPSFSGYPAQDFPQGAITFKSRRFLLGDGGDSYIGGSPGAVTTTNISDRHGATYKPDRKVKKPGVANVLFCDFRVGTQVRAEASLAVLNPGQGQ